MKQKLLAVLCVLFTVQMTAWAEEKSGYCGDPAVNGGMDLRWVLSEDSVLTISGTGEMKDYSYPKNVPWNRCINKVYIDGEVTSIGDYAFCFCSGLTSISIPNSVTSIGDYAFEGCSGLTSITIPNSVTSISSYAFSGCSGLTSITVDKNNTTYDSRGNCNAIIETGSNSLVVGCKSTVIPNSVTSIGSYAFDGCSSLTSITIPNSVTSIGDNAFYNCFALTSLAIPNSVTSLGDWTFSYCSSLTHITIPNSVACIGEGVFNGCSGLTNITIPNSVTSIGNDAFNGCSGFTSITIPSSVTSIGNGVFSCCSNLTDITIPNSVTNIGDWAFGECFSLTSITIPNSVTSIGGSAFYCCKNLALMTVDKDNTVYDSRDNCNAIIETATNTLTMGCMNTLIPNSVTNIGEEAFYGCDSLTSIIIPNSVTSIGKNAYSWCPSLSIVTCLNPVPPMLNGSQFYRISETAILRVPDVEAYKASDWAKYFSNIEQTDLTAIRAIEAGRKSIPTTIHDLGGRRVTEPVKGRIYIVDGKTVVW